MLLKAADFHLGADVAAADGTTVGFLVSVLVEADGFDPRAIVVKVEATRVARLIAGEKLFITDEVVVPIADVQSATHNAVRLSLGFESIHRLVPYISYHFAAMTPGEVLLEEAQMIGGGLGIPKAEEEANKPSAEIEIDRDENVMLGRSGKLLGHVHDVLFNEGEIIGVVIRPAGLFKHDVVLPVRFLARADDMALFADLSEADIEELKPFDPSP